MRRPIMKYIIFCAIVILLAIGIARVDQNGMGSGFEGVANWWNGVCENFETLISKEDSNEAITEATEVIEPTTEATEVVEPTIETTEVTEPTTEATEVTEPSTEATEPATEATVPEEQPPVSDEPVFIENSDKTLNMCSYEFLSWAQRNEQYNEKEGCGPFNIPHAEDEVYQVFFSPCEQMEALMHNHEGQKCNMMINLNKVSVFCCDDKNADHDTGIWNMNSIFCVGFDDTRVEVCKKCDGLANGDNAIGEIMQLELSEEDWNEMQKLACYWWETDEETGERVRIFGLKSCTCDKPTVGDKPTGTGKPSGGGNSGKDPTKPTKPTNPTKPTDPDDTPEHNEKPDPNVPAHNDKPTPVKPGDNDEAVSTPVDNPGVDHGTPPVVSVPEEQPAVKDEVVSTPVNNPGVDHGTPPAVSVPEDQPAVKDEAVSTPVDNPGVNHGTPPAVSVPEEQPAVDVKEPAHSEKPAVVACVGVESVSEEQPPVVVERVSAPVEATEVDHGAPPVVVIP